MLANRFMVCSGKLISRDTVQTSGVLSDDLLLVSVHEDIKAVSFTFLFIMPRILVFRPSQRHRKSGGGCRLPKSSLLATEWSLKTSSFETISRALKPTVTSAAARSNAFQSACKDPEWGVLRKRIANDFKRKFEKMLRK